MISFDYVYLNVFRRLHKCTECGWGGQYSKEYNICPDCGEESVKPATGRYVLKEKTSWWDIFDHHEIEWKK